VSLSSLLLFVGIYATAVATPGPGVAALIARVLGRGLTGVAPLIAGFVVGDMVWFTIATTGLAMLAHEFAGLFAAVRIAGCLYLLYLAWGLWRSPARAAAQGLASPGDGGRSAFLGALSLTLGNPKVIVFFLSIMPLVVDLRGVTVTIAVELMATMAILLSAILLTYAALANRARNLFASPRAMKALNRSASGVMASAALALAVR
jgi:threonine/homoserine/homoserine lactone efflux protein